MKMLCIDASGKTAACAVTDGDNILADSLLNTGLTHSQTLLPEVDRILKESDVDISEIDEFAVTTGPGSFTGLRIGLALVMGLAGNRPIRAVPTLFALAHNADDRDGIVIPALDARRQQVYSAVFRCSGGVISRLEDDCAEPVERIIKKAKEYEKTDPIIILGDGAYLFDNIITDKIKFAKNLYPTGKGIFKAAKSIAPLTARDIRLNYLRLSQAERELKEKMKK